jgi:hypothetical protein
MLLMMYAIDDNEKCFKQYTPKQRNKNCPAVIARLSNQHCQIIQPTHQHLYPCPPRRT